VLKAGRRAETLTGQLLAFSRRKPISPQIVGVNELISDLRKMLARVVGEDIRIEEVLSQEVGNVRIDPGSLEQVIMNLCVNARDAMPHGGKVRILTRDIFLQAPSSYGVGFHVEAGHYVEILISDEGTGMDEATMRRVFEPFFTTKDVGAGTGLGLATCYGIVQQAGGYVSVASELGVGTTFGILLPATSAIALRKESVPPSLSMNGRETILVVEDEEPLRRLAVRALSEFGYRVSRRLVSRWATIP
jgi:signal transduction histidine kinase